MAFQGEVIAHDGEKELFFLGGYEKTFCLSCVYVEPCKYLKISRNGFYHYAMDSPLFKVKKRNQKSGHRYY